jgi:predicted PolB exonuclease-like 3'-5' exonuclease
LRNHLALDIETVPIKELSKYSPVVQNKLNEKIEKRKERDPDFDYTYFASTHGDFGKIICISLGYVSEDNQIHLKSLVGNDEATILRDFNEMIDTHQGIYIHYNGLNFDIPFILQRMAYCRIPPKGRSFVNLRRFSNDPHFDVMMAYYNWDYTKTLPLGILAELHGLPSPKEELAGDQVFEAYQKNEWDKISHYCEFDTATTLNLWWKIFQNKSPIPFQKYLFSDKPIDKEDQFSLNF